MIKSGGTAASWNPLTWNAAQPCIEHEAPCVNGASGGSRFFDTFLGSPSLSVVVSPVPELRIYTMNPHKDFCPHCKEMTDTYRLMSGEKKCTLCGRTKWPIGNLADVYNRGATQRRMRQAAQAAREE